MKEPISNIGFVCSEHAPKPGKYTAYDPSKIVGSFCKLGFPCKKPDGSDLIEHMWVEVTEILGESLKGRLDNDPIGVYEGDFKGLSCGDNVEFTLEEVEEILTP